MLPPKPTDDIFADPTTFDAVVQKLIVDRTFISAVEGGIGAAMERKAAYDSPPAGGHHIAGPGVGQAGWNHFVSALSGYPVPMPE